MFLLGLMATVSFLASVFLIFTVRDPRRPVVHISLAFSSQLVERVLVIPCIVTIPPGGLVSLEAGERVSKGIVGIIAATVTIPSSATAFFSAIKAPWRSSQLLHRVMQEQSEHPVISALYPPSMWSRKGRALAGLEPSLLFSGGGLSGHDHVGPPAPCCCFSVATQVACCWTLRLRWAEEGCCCSGFNIQMTRKSTAGKCSS